MVSTWSVPILLTAVTAPSLFAYFTSVQKQQCNGSPVRPPPMAWQSPFPFLFFLLDEVHIKLHCSFAWERKKTFKVLKVGEAAEVSSTPSLDRLWIEHRHQSSARSHLTMLPKLKEVFDPSPRGMPQEACESYSH